ncbi:ATP-dependent helicase [Candidatus Poribacteria bacterium]|nr:ATP-dependent helicase [Candidatus Poribacteria bacterium]
MSLVELNDDGIPGIKELSSLFEPYVWEWFQDTFGKPSPPQLASWPRIAEGRNTLIFSPTGSGKTLAAFLWCINDLFSMGAQKATVYGEVPLQDAVYVLYISPLKALNNDIQKNLTEPLEGIKNYAKRHITDVPDIRSEVRTGDTTQSQRARMARRPPHILITTPESLFIILTTQKFREALRTVKYVIVDEIHAMSDNKRGVHLSSSLERLQDFAREDFTRIGLSATQKPLDRIAKYLVGVDNDGNPRDCEIVDVGARKDLNVRVISPVDNLLESHFDAIWGSSYAHMLSMVHEHDTTLIFTNSRYKTERTSLRLNELSEENPVNVGAHHGSMSKNVRLDMENKLKNSEMDALVATSSLELGIDVGSIDLVCQIQSPKSVSKGMQRIGRAGHLLNATSKGRLLVTDRDDLVESAVLVWAIMEGEIDTTRIPMNCLDVLAQQITAAVAADDWEADDLYRLMRHSYCFKDLERDDFDRVLDMLAANYSFRMERPPYAKISWDKVNNILRPERSARLIAFRSGGTIPDVNDYDVYFGARKTKVGQLDEGFVEELHTGDIFILGSSSWQVTGIEKNRVVVEDVYGKAPTIPFWGGDRDSRTYDLGVLVGKFRRTMDAMLDKTISEIENWLVDEYFVNENGAKSIYEYFREQKSVMDHIPSDQLVMVEHFHNELGQQQIIIHSSFGIRMNDPWAMAITEAIRKKYGFRIQYATVDDGILLTMPPEKEIDPHEVLDLVNIDNVDDLLQEAVFNSPVFASRFRHNAVRALLVLREYKGRKTPVWLQNLRASELLEACREDKTFPLILETMRECMNESLDVPNLLKVLENFENGIITSNVIDTKIPSPFTHTLLLVGQYGDFGTISDRERKSRMMHLHREVLRQILDEETLRNLLDEEAVQSVESRLQHTDPQRKARDANELARVISDLGDLVLIPDDEISIQDRSLDDAGQMMMELVKDHRIIRVPLSTTETNRERWITTENFPLYRAAFGIDIKTDDKDDEILEYLKKSGAVSLSRIPVKSGIEKPMEKLINGYRVLRLHPQFSLSADMDSENTRVEYVSVDSWIPENILEQDMERLEARKILVERFMRTHGPVTKYEIMERYGFSDTFVGSILSDLYEEGSIVSGEYVPTKSFPQWCYKANLEEIHRLTLNRLRKEMEPATPEEYNDFLIRWQHVHPDTRLSGVDGLTEAIGQLQGYEVLQGVIERDMLPSRVKDYNNSMLDRLCYSGQVFWRRFDYKSLKRGRIGFCFREDRDWVVTNPKEVDMKVDKWDEDIPEQCNAVRDYLRKNGPSFFDDIVKTTDIDWRYVLRAIWHLVWTGEATNDGYESIRHAGFTSGLSGCYDLFKKPWSKGVTVDYIIKHMLDYRRLDPTLGRWVPTERLLPDSMETMEAEVRAAKWAELLLKRYGIMCKDCMKREQGTPSWGDIRKALIKMELLGKIRRGFFVQELSGEQFAYPETVELLREAKLRNPESDDENSPNFDPDEPMILLNVIDPANAFTSFLSLTDEAGEDVKLGNTPHNYVVCQYGKPIVSYAISSNHIKILADLTDQMAEKAIRTIMQLVDNPPPVESYKEINIRDWNGHPIDVSPARYLLMKLGFVNSGTRSKGFVYDGLSKADDATIMEMEQNIPEIFERVDKEKAPVTYDAQWIISRSYRDIRDQVKKLLELLQKELPKKCEFHYYPRRIEISYRGVKCINPHIQKRQIRLQITHRGWTPGILIDSDTDLNSPEFMEVFQTRFQKTRQAIDDLLDS